MCGGGLEEVTGWIYENDRRWLLENLPETIDLLVNVKGLDSVSEPGKRLDVWLNDVTQISTACYRTMHSVQWRLARRPEVPADGQSKVLNNTLPMSVGAEPMDALITIPKQNGVLDTGTPARHHC